VAQTHIDWKRTRAYSGAAGDQAIYLNVAGRDPQGVVMPGDDYDKELAAVKEIIQSLFDHSHGEYILDAIYRKEDIYQGKYLDTAPDLVLQCRPGYVITDKRSEAKLLNPAGKQTGWHSPEGMFAASGPGIKKGPRLSPLKLADILPTLLYSRNLPLLKTFDGESKKELFSPTFQDVHQVRWQEQSTERSTEKAYVDEDIIRQRLKSLGYL
jgi:predicted AlkP superfamily phosphohydrolase/phosphomutase